MTPKPEDMLLHSLGEFKLKDKEGRDSLTITHPTEEWLVVKALHIRKVVGKSNTVEVVFVYPNPAEWDFDLKITRKEGSHA